MTVIWESIVSFEYLSVGAVNPHIYQQTAGRLWDCLQRKNLVSAANYPGMCFLRAVEATVWSSVAHDFVYCYHGTP